MKVLLTGAAGFIGRYVLRELQSHGHVVVPVDSYVQQVHGKSGGSEAIPVRSLGNFCKHWRVMTNDLDAVIHLAAEVGVGQSQYEPVRYAECNVMETARLWEAIMTHRASIKSVVVASSMSIYGEGLYVDQDTNQAYTHGGLMRAPERGWDAFDFRYADGPRMPLRSTPQARPTREDKLPEPSSIYALSKYDTERYSLMLGDLYDVRTVALRFFNVFGPGQALSNPYTGVLAAFACRVLNGQPPVCSEDAQQTRDFIYVEDIARAVVGAMEAEHCHGVFNVGTGRATSIGALAEAWVHTAREMGLCKSVEIDIPGYYRKGDVRHCFSDSALLRRTLQWDAQIGLHEGLKRTAAWIVANDLHTDAKRPKDTSAHAAAEMARLGLMTAPLTQEQQT